MPTCATVSKPWFTCASRKAGPRIQVWGELQERASVMHDAAVKACWLASQALGVALLFGGCSLALDTDKYRAGLVPADPTEGEPCSAASDCGEQTLCERAVGACHAAGRCELLPKHCDDALQPVCGCDQTTYFNDCERRRAAVALLAPGPCAGNVDPDRALADRPAQ